MGGQREAALGVIEGWEWPSQVRRDEVHLELGVVQSFLGVLELLQGKLSAYWEHFG